MSWTQRISLVVGIVALSLIGQFASAQVCDSPLKAWKRGKVKYYPGHYVAIGSKAEVNEWYANTLAEISAPAFSGKIVGIQKRYYWADLNPAPDTYDFKQINDDIIAARHAGKKLSVMIMFKFRNNNFNYTIPKYVRDLPPATVGDQVLKPYYEINGDGYQPKSGISHFGHPEVRKHFIKMLSALAAEIDDRFVVSSIVFPESAMGIVPGEEPYEDLTNSEFAKIRNAHIDGLLEVDKQVPCIFKETPFIQLTNYPPDMLPKMFDVYSKWTVGIGGPDIWTDSKDKVQKSYGYIMDHKKDLPVGFIIAGGNYIYTSREGEKLHIKKSPLEANYRHQNVNGWTKEETPGKTVQLLAKRASELGANYIFWKKNGPDGDNYYAAFKKEIVKMRTPAQTIVPTIEKCPHTYTWDGGFGAGCIQPIP
jgi:hypothetical protein